MLIAKSGISFCLIEDYNLNLFFGQEINSLKINYK